MNKPFTVDDYNRIRTDAVRIGVTNEEWPLYITMQINQWHSQQSGWVKCEDRLPTTFLPTYNGTKSNLLVLLDENGNTCIGRFFIQYYDGGKIESFWNEFEDEITGVTHYIELPVFP